MEARQDSRSEPPRFNACDGGLNGTPARCPPQEQLRGQNRVRPADHGNSSESRGMARFRISGRENLLSTNVQIDT
jgi:hypothetical protein